MYGDVSTDQRQRLGSRVGQVDGNVADALARPEEGHREGGELALVKEDQGARGRQQHLEGRAAEHGEEARENEGKSMPRLMNDEVDTAEEPKRAAARGEVEVALEDLPAEHRHHDQGEGPGGDGEPREERPANLRPWRRKRRPVRDGRTGRRFRRQGRRLAGRSSRGSPSPPGPSPWS